MSERWNKFVSIVKEYASRLLDYDIALWMFMIITYTMVAALTLAVLEMKGGDPETIVELGHALERGLWLAIGILFGRPVLKMAGRGIYNRVSSS